jgi:hypothetical protein
LKKYLGYILAVLGLVLLLPFSANAEEFSEVLTKKELQTLTNKVGLTEDEIKNYPTEVLRQLIKENAKKVASGSTIETFYEPSAESSPGTITTMGTIPSTDIKLAGTAYKVTSDISGRDKFYFYGSFQWLKSPTWELTDKMTIGFPSGYGFYLPTSGGSVTQHQHRYSWDSDKNGSYTDYSIKYTPVSWSANAGVAGAYDLIAGEGLHKGYIGQYVYVPTTNNGSMNIKIEYGHKVVSGSVSVGVYPAGLGITPSTNTDTRSYALTINY